MLWCYKLQKMAAFPQWRPWIEEVTVQNSRTSLCDATQRVNRHRDHLRHMTDHFTNFCNCNHAATAQGSSLFLTITTFENTIKMLCDVRRPHWVINMKSTALHFLHLPYHYHTFNLPAAKICKFCDPQNLKPKNLTLQKSKHIHYQTWHY